MDWRLLKDIPPWEWPTGAARRLLEVLRDPQTSEEDLQLGAELAGDYVVINQDLLLQLLALVENDHKSAELRSQSAISMGPAFEQFYLRDPDDPDDDAISEKTFEKIQGALKRLYDRTGVPEAVRRSILEASVRAPQEWHKDAIRTAYDIKSDPWVITAVFCMQYVRGFEQQILEALTSSNPDIHFEAVRAAGGGEVDAAWPHIVEFAKSKTIDKDLRIEAIKALSAIRPKEALMVLDEIGPIRDQDLSEVIEEARTMADTDGDEDEDDLDESDLN